MMGVSKEGEKGDPVSEINVTPMVDVMLVLLIIFMVIAPMLQPRIRVAVPKGRNPELDMRIDRDTSVVLAAPEDGLIYLNREQIAFEFVEERIRAALNGRPPEERIVFIKGGRTVKYGTIVSLINSIRSAGCVRVGLVSEKEDAAGRCNSKRITSFG